MKKHILWVALLSLSTLAAPPVPGGREKGSASGGAGGGNLAIAEFRNLGRETLDRLEEDGHLYPNGISIAELRERINSVEIQTTPTRIYQVNPETQKEEPVDVLVFAKENRILLSLYEWPRYPVIDARRWIVLHTLVELESEEIDDPKFRKSFAILQLLDPQFEFRKFDDINPGTMAAVKKSCDRRKAKLIAQTEPFWNAPIRQSIRKRYFAMKERIEQEIEAEGIREKIQSLYRRDQLFEKQEESGQLDPETRIFLSEALARESETFWDNLSSRWKSNAVVRCDPVRRIKRNGKLSRRTVNRSIGEESVNGSPTCRHLTRRGKWKKEREIIPYAMQAETWSRANFYEYFHLNRSSKLYAVFRMVQLVREAAFSTHRSPRAPRSETLELTASLRSNGQTYFDLSWRGENYEDYSQHFEIPFIEIVAAETLEDAVALQIAQPCRSFYGWETSVKKPRELLERIAK